MNEISCPNCGCPIEELKGYGLIITIYETNVGELTDLFDGVFDDTSCKACGYQLQGVQQTVIVVFGKPRVAWCVLGTRMQSKREEFFTIASQEYKKHNIPIEILPSLDVLRSVVSDQLKSRLVLLELLSKAYLNGEIGTYITKNWRSITSEFFAATKVASTGRVPDLYIGWQDVNEPEDEVVSAETLTNFLAQVQAKMWVALAASWMLSNEDHDSTLEKDLKRYIHPETIIPGSPDICFESFDRLLQVYLDIHYSERFCLEAIRASLYAAIGQPNPYAGDLAELLIAKELGLLLEDDSELPKLKTLTLSPEHIHTIVNYRQAWNAFAPWFEETLRMNDEEKVRFWLKLLEEVAQKIGYPSIVEELFEFGIRYEKKDISPQQLIDSMREIASRRDREVTIQVIQTLASALLGRLEHLDSLEQLADTMIDLQDRSFEAQAKVNAWFGRCCEEQRQPRRFLKRIGDTPQDWEQHLPLQTCLPLWIERSNALRLTGRLDDAFRLSKEIVDLCSDDVSRKDRHTAQLHYAILLRETGSPDAALQILTSLVAETTHYERLAPLQALVSTYFVFRNFDETIRCCDEALAITTGPWATQASYFHLIKARALIEMKRYAEVPQQLKEVQFGSSYDPYLTLSVASVQISIIKNSSKQPMDDHSRLLMDNQMKLLKETLSLMIGEAKKRGDVFVLTAALRLLALLLEPSPLAEQYWQKAYEICTTCRQIPDPFELLALACFAYERGNIQIGRNYLLQVPTAFAGLLGGIEDLSPVVQSFDHLLDLLDKLATTTLFHPTVQTPFEDIRLVSELRRDTIRRAQALRKGLLTQYKEEILTQGLTSDVLVRLAPASGRLGVLEWVDNGKLISPFLTCITADKEVSSYWLDLLDMDMCVAIKKVINRLRNWQINRGDPFDIPGWRRLEQRFVDALTPYMGENDHIVFIEHKEYLGTPWHVAVASRWTSSYVASWTSLLSLHSLPLPDHVTTVGVVLVPTFGDRKAASELLGALKHSAQRTRSFALEHGVNFFLAEEEACDRDAFCTIMNKSDLVKLMCHGFVAQDGEVSLALAHNGSIPFSASLLGGEAGRVYRFSWRDCQRLSIAPPVIFSAACSSGFSHLAGLGERLGLFSALRYAGTRALVAPRWNINPDRVLPILDDAFESYMRGDVSLAYALREACNAAESVQPRWLAWALALEGDWRCNNR